MIKFLADIPMAKIIIYNLQLSLDEFRKHIEERIREFMEENKKLIEDIPIVKLGIIEYRMDSLYCTKCHRIYAPRYPRISGYNSFTECNANRCIFRIGMRMSIENVSSTVFNIFGILMSEGKIQNTLSKLSDYLGKEYENLLNRIRNALSRNMDSTS